MTAFETWSGEKALFMMDPGGNGLKAVIVRISLYRKDLNFGHVKPLFSIEYVT